MNLLDELKARNIINNITNEDKVKNFFANKNSSFYIGFDPSFRSLHLGNYLQLVTLKRLVNAGYNAYALIGGATGKIGDPSGKNNERKLLEQKTIDENVTALTRQIKKITNCSIINNENFYKDMNLFTFFRTIGKSININYLLEKDIIARRLETGISFAEFSYALIQAYDFLYLYKNHNVTMQIGGSDQWGNITTGIELIRKEIGDDNKACGLTLNLLTKSDGTKFGKSESGAIYLDEKITSAYQLYQFLVNQADQDLEKLFLSLTFYSINEIKEIIEKHNKNKSIRYGQKLLAKTIVSNLHGKAKADECTKISEIVFSGNLSSLNEETLLDVLSNIPHFIADKHSYNICDLLVEASICPSKSNARQLIQSKSIYVNDQLIEDFNTEINSCNALGKNKKFSYIKKGKKNFYLINWR